MWRVRERKELGLIPRFLAETSGWRGLEAGPDPGLFTHNPGPGRCSSFEWPLSC